MGQTVKEKKNISLRIAAVLLCLTLISSYLSAGLFARYTVQGNGKDSARVAGFCPTAELVSGDQKIEYVSDKDEYELTYTIKLTNPSEVAVKYDLVISFIDQKLNGTTFTFSGEPQSVTGSGSSPSDSLTFSGKDVLSANKTTPKEEPLTLTVSKDIVDVFLNEATESELDLSACFTATVTFTQVD